MFYRRLVDRLSYNSVFSPHWTFLQTSVVYLYYLHSQVSDRDTDVKMWHVGVHIWEIPPNDIEPDYDEYYQVRLGPFRRITNLTAPGSPRL